MRRYFTVHRRQAHRRFFGALVLLMSTSTAAHAADGICEGTISGQALIPLPPDTAFDIEVYDNSEQNLRLRQRFLQALREAGFQTADGGPLMIDIASERLFPRYRPDTRAVGTPTTDATKDRLGVNRTRSTIENLAPPPPNSPAGLNRRFEEQIEVRFEVRDAETRKFVWLGQVSCSPLTENRSLIIDTVFDAFTESVGKTVKGAAL